MAYDFKKINELELVNEVPEGANVLIETEGTTKRLPSTAINNGYSKDEVYNKTETDEKFLTKETIAKPDWNQNDSEAADYVKNRTHYEETNVTLLDNLSVSDGYTWDYEVDLALVEGETYRVVVDGEEHECVAKRVGEYITLGNAYLDFDEGEDTGEAFLVVDYDSGTLARHTERDTIHTFSVIGNIIHKIDKKFLPDDVGGGSAPIVYIIDKSGDETVYSCSVDFETARTKRFSVPVYVKIITDKYCVREAFKVYTNGDDSSVDVHYEYYISEQGYSDSFVHDADGVHIVEPK